MREGSITIYDAPIYGRTVDILGAIDKREARKALIKCIVNWHKSEHDAVASTKGDNMTHDDLGIQLPGALSSIAKIAAGPALNIAATSMGVPLPAIKIAADIATKARKGDPKAKKQVKAIAAKAKAGDPKAKKALAVTAKASQVMKAAEKKVAAQVLDVGPSLHNQGVAAQALRSRIA